MPKKPKGKKLEIMKPIPEIPKRKVAPKKEQPKKVPSPTPAELRKAQEKARGKLYGQGDRPKRKKPRGRPKKKPQEGDGLAWEAMKQIWKLMKATKHLGKY